MNKYSTEVVRRVYDETEGDYVQIGPSPDFPGNVVLMTDHDKGSAAFFGKMRLDMPAEFMRQIAHALLIAASEADEEKGKP